MATAPDSIVDTTNTDAPAAAPQTDQAAQVSTANDMYPDERQGAVEGDLREGEEAQEGAEGQEEGGEADLEPIAAPTSWAKDYKDKFEALPRDMQEIIAARETERDKFVNQKSMEAAKTRQTVESEARQILATLQRNHAEQISRYAQKFDAPPPDERLLYTGRHEDQLLYNQQQARYQSTAAQRDQAQREADSARQQAAAIQQHEQQLVLQEQHRILAEAIPEWSEPSSRAKLLNDLQPIAAELGYSDEVMSQANASDILALRKIAEYRADAEKYRDLMKKKMVPVRAAKTIPPAARTGVPSGKSSQPVSAAALMYPNDVRRN